MDNEIKLLFKLINIVLKDTNKKNVILYLKNVLNRPEGVIGAESGARQ